MATRALWNYWPWTLASATAAAGAAAALWTGLKQKHLDLWMWDYLFQWRGRSYDDWEQQPLQVFLTVCDHFEPENGCPPKAMALDRVLRWRQEYPRLFAPYRDCRGRPPQHTFFYPADEYAPEYLDLIAELCEQGLGDVEIHLHHDNDTAEGLRHTLEEFKHTLHDRHGLLRRDPFTQELVYGFIHGNWALCNSRPDGRWCGVNNEIPILRETGCYADFTMPSAPMDTQCSTINSIYYAKDIPGQPKSHDRGIAARVGQEPPEDSLLLIQGPLLLNWRERRHGLLPRIENGDLTVANPPTWNRLRHWLRAGVSVVGKPNWIFVKLHTHGAKPGNIDMWLGDQVQAFHADLARHAQENPLFQYYYVTAYEMAQLVHQAERGAFEPEFGDPLALLKS